MQTPPAGHLHHPDLPPAHSAWAESQTLHVAACHINPFRWRTRRELTNDFRRHMMGLPNVRLHMIEVAYGDRPFEATDPGLYPDDIQLRTQSELFHKENALNICIQRSFPADWRYGAIIDADFNFPRTDVALETIQQLQHHAWVQMFSSYIEVDGEMTRGQGHLPLMQPRKSFMFTYYENDHRIAFGYLPNGEPDPRYGKVGVSGYGKAGVALPGAGKLVRTAPGATGGAWAFTRDGFNTCGGLIDRCILGSGDWFMAFGLVGGEEGAFPFIRRYHPDYTHYIEQWQRRAGRLAKNVGYVDTFAIHQFHGPKTKRQYGDRDKILVDNQYSPVEDVSVDHQGLLQLNPGKPRLRDQIRAYFRTRIEDAPNDGVNVYEPAKKQ